MTRKSFNLEIKAVQEDGFFSGYGAVFGNIDWYNDVILPGAFTASIAKWRAKNKMPPVLWNHNDSEPIGVYTNIYEDEKGLYVEGKLLIDDVPRAKSTHALLKAGAIDGLSIGYSTKKANQQTNGVRELVEVDLSEISIVTQPANERSLITSVKSKLDDGELPTLPEFEKFLRESGFSKNQATAIASKGLRSLLSESEEETKEAKSISNALNILKGVSNV
ncbi:HK97 family phage prohead protease [Acinetobacter baumannii]|uniref:Peptidase U35 n=4 Tax=Acinetobacter calcoaceticus/baumannii complex TaxID=909768 RepID=A0AB36M5T7_ACINO|nr:MULTISPECIES: HK97 family phage prohead protease [Acinetobacter calcoaceticus/baumannii complex]KCZ28336.1 phage prohead protease, HK97 family [Acinetobacter baumannii 25977_9]EKU6036658.1 HK97 family phage prohead protease [Acinetobacter nosocomialis]EKW8140794.1 HK97 family phage prohead protease [Acinetobacter baumannii]ELA6826488.1 HK97 family phage prohead protease [Acinetobacter baumannii]ELA6834171.1 HK97 family phage prohead protease [Acinetobacter baumannii]